MGAGDGGSGRVGSSGREGNTRRVDAESTGSALVTLQLDLSLSAGVCFRLRFNARGRVCVTHTPTHTVGTEPRPKIKIKREREDVADIRGCRASRGGGVGGDAGRGEAKSKGCDCNWRGCRKGGILEEESGSEGGMGGRAIALHDGR